MPINRTAIYKFWCPTCEKWCEDFGDLIWGEQSVVHRVCGFIVQKKIKRWNER